MTTLTLHAHVQRSRFVHHVFEWLGRLAASPWTRTKPPSPAAEAQHVRRLAGRYRNTDPGFAADLYAAAARHEG